MTAERPRTLPSIVISVATIAISIAAPPQQQDLALLALPPVELAVTFEPGIVQVLDAGRGPLDVLRYGVPSNARAAFRLALASSELDIVVRGACELPQISSFDAPVVACTVVEVDRGPPALAMLEVVAERDQVGRVYGATIKHHPSLPAAIAKQVAAELVSLEQLPYEPVGIGATWEETVLVGADRPRVARTRHVQLVARAGSALALRTTITDHSGKQGDLMSLDAAGDETRRVDLRSYVDHSLGTYTGVAAFETPNGPVTRPLASRVERSVTP